MRKQTTCADGMPGSKVFINEGATQGDLWEDNARLSSSNRIQLNRDPAFLQNDKEKESETQHFKMHNKRHSCLAQTSWICTVSGQDVLCVKAHIIGLRIAPTSKLMKTENPSCRQFCFGDENLAYSTRKVKLPAKVGQIETEVIKVDIPLLLSKLL